MKSIVVDNLRFIHSTHTLVRCLGILSKYVKTIGSNQTPKEILKQQLIHWSAELEGKSEEYKNHNGKLTNKKKPTTAFNKYVDLLEGLGLVTSFGHVLSNTRLGSLLSLFTKGKDDFDFPLNFQEKLFFLYLLIQKDADVIVVILQTLNKAVGPVNQAYMQMGFETSIEDRLQLKEKFATIQAKQMIREKLRVIQYEWTKPEVYSEHIIAPRLEWLADLGLVEMRKQAGNTLYNISGKGEIFYKSLDDLQGYEMKDINEDWLIHKAFACFAVTLLDRSTISYWGNISLPERKSIMKNYLLQTYKLFSTGGAMRMALYPSMLYISMKLLAEKGIVIEFKEIADELKETLTIDDKSFIIRPSPRLTEAYISVKAK